MAETIIHLCENHLVVVVDAGTILMFGDPGTECVGEISECEQVANERVKAEAMAAAAWN